MTNNKAYLTPSGGLNSWSGRFEIMGFKTHDTALAMESLSDGGFFINKLYAECRTGEPLALPPGGKARYIKADG